MRGEDGPDRVDSGPVGLVEDVVIEHVAVRCLCLFVARPHVLTYEHVVCWAIVPRGAIVE